MLNLVIGVVVGGVIMDFLWAWRLGIPQIMWKRFRARKQIGERR